jgi:hypothetical protein
MHAERDDSPGIEDAGAFNLMFAADWLFGRGKAEDAERWRRLERKMVAGTAESREGRLHPVERRRNLSPEEFKETYFVPGVPVVLEGAAADWPAIRKWTPEYLERLCGEEQIPVLDGVNWKVNREAGAEVVSTSENQLHVRELLEEVRRGGAWYGAFMELLDRHADLRADLDLSFIEKFGHTSRLLPWQRRVLAKMYVGGPGTATSLHCAGVSNLYVQVHGRKKWVLIPSRFTPFMYLAFSNGLNWQSRVDFRNPDYGTCPLYRFVDRYETVLEAGDVLWNPPFVWHGVANLTTSIAVSLWWINVTRAFRSNFMLSALTLCGRPNPIAIQLGLSGMKGDGKSAFSVHLNR